MTNTTIPSTPILIEDLGMLYPTENSKRKSRYGIYQCQCGNTFKTTRDSIISKKTKSCGCYLATFNKIHGDTKERLYQTWADMLNRCSDTNNINYFQRGIKVCEEWKDYSTFKEWAVANGYTDKLTIDRRNNDEGYNPSNCRWTTKDVQARNTRVLNSTNTSGYRGVSWSKSKNKWRSDICINKKQIYIDLFTTAIEAAKAYDFYIFNNTLEHTPNKSKEEWEEFLWEQYMEARIEAAEQAAETKAEREEWN